uniref:ATP synthase complex subunit 8 n=1 Tax=Athyma sulpitia TaxID=1170475 RepID=I0B039_ATHSU|nr:ATP synthase F0 subunit 8 [Athyma sulpitia]YP_010429038.1 ATP synthase F0 subunit 8 [Limenitis sulpitia]AFH54890.1 ATP synthase F0 subunit 8 [Athyma sulpitia]USO21460.1 ATP synthase F0 subunit 8 [Limenitis sulpitia]
MPQMMPINWIFSLIFFISIFIIFNIMNYFIFNYKNINYINKNNKLMKNNFYWKW